MAPIKVGRMAAITKAGVAIALMGLCVAACSSASANLKKPSPTSTTTADSSTSTSVVYNAKIAGAFLAGSTPVGAISNTFETEYQKWSATTTGAQAETEAQPTISVYKYFDTVLAAQDWSANARADVATLRGAISQVLKDLESLSTVTPSDYLAWIAKYQGDTAQVGQAEARVRADLGLSPAPTT